MKTEQGNFPSYLLILILVMGAFGVMGGGLIAPVLPIIGENFSVPKNQVGLVLSLHTFSSALSLPLIGFFIDKVGRRRVGLICLLINGTTGLSAVFVSDFTVLLILRFIQGIGIAGLIPVTMTIIRDLFTGKRKLQIIGYLSGTISLGAVILPSLGGLLASLDWRLVFAVYGLSLILAAIFFPVLPETSPCNNENSRVKQKNNTLLSYIKSLFSVLKVGKIRNVMINSLALYFFLYTLITYLPIYLNEGYGFSGLFAGLFISLQGFFAMVLASKAGLIAEYLNWKQRLLLGFALISVSFILLPFWPKGSYLISLSLVAFGSGMGLVTPTINNRATTLSPPEMSGSVISIFNTMKYIGMTLSPLMLGLFLKYTDLDTIFVSVGVLAAIWGFRVFR